LLSFNRYSIFAKIKHIIHINTYRYMTSFTDLITTRRSVRQYTEEPLTPEQVQLILRAALIAPTSKNSRAWQFVLVDDKETLKKLSQCKSSGATFVEHAALAIVVLNDPLLSEAYHEDMTIAATYIQLQAQDLGLGSCWVQIAGRETDAGYDSEQYVRDLLEIPLQLAVGCIISIGHPARVGKPHDEAKIQWEKLHVGKY
jgi:nitroreductase